MDEMVDNDRPTNKARYARNSSWPGALGSTKGRIHLRRLVFSTLAFSLQSDGGPYIFGHMVQALSSVSALVMMHPLKL